MTSSYLQPTSTVDLPNGLTISQFIQTVVVGVSGLDGTLVRPKWQYEPPKEPNVTQNWMAIGIETASPDANAYVTVDADGNNVFQRHEEIEVSCDVYGPNALGICGLIRDGFQIPQNRYALFQNNIGFKNVSEAKAMPDLVNERFLRRYVMSIFLRREIQRVYAIPTIVSVSGTIYSVVGNEEYLLPFAASQ